MSKHKTLKKILAVSIAAGAAMHMTNRYLSQYAISKNLLKKEDGKLFPFKYGNIFYKVSGHGKPVLLIHDIHEASSGIEWFYLEKKLSKKYKVYTIDLLGCGRSEKPKLTYNNFLYVQLITDFIKQVIEEPTDIIATGKSVAPVIMAAKLEESSIDRIILINPTDLVDLSDVPTLFTKAKKAVLTTPILGTFIYHMLHKRDQIYYSFMNEYFSDPEADFEQICEYYYEAAHKDQSGSKYLYASIQGNYTTMNINHALKTLNKKLLIIAGNDYYESDYVPEEYERFNSNVEWMTVLGTCYLPQLEAPSRILEAIDSYWTEE